jgi:hypothetical protein
MFQGKQPVIILSLFIGGTVTVDSSRLSPYGVSLATEGEFQENIPRTLVESDNLNLPMSVLT